MSERLVIDRVEVAAEEGAIASPWSRFWRNTQGVTAIEFAFVGPIFFVLVFAILQYSYLFVTETVLDNAVFVSVRDARTGALQQRQTTPQNQRNEIRNIICNQAGVIIPRCAGGALEVDINTFPNFAAIDLTDENNTNGTPGAGGPEDIVVVRAEYDLPLFGLFGIGFDDVAEVKLRSFAIYRNEPFEE